MRRTTILNSNIGSMALFALALVFVTTTVTTAQVTVGSNNYTTLKGAFDAINSGLYTGNIIIDITGNTTETSSAVLYYSGYSLANYTSILIRPVGGQRIIEGSLSSQAIIQLWGADNVTIDGRINGTGNNLTIRNNSTSSYATAIWLRSYGVNAGCNYNTIRNCNILSGSRTTTNFGIYMAGTSSISTGANGPDNDYNSFISNNIRQAYYGIYAYGNSSSNPNQGLTISDNSIGSSTDAESIGYCGIYTYYNSNFLINGNTIFNISYTTVYGVYLYYAQNGTFSGNIIRDLKRTTSSSVYGVYYYSPNGNVTFANNMLGNMISTGYVYGLYLSNGPNCKIYHNTIYMSGNRDQLGTPPSSSYRTYAVYISSSVYGLDMRNNIFANTQTAATNGPKSYVVYLTSTSSPFSISDDNVYYTSGNQGMLFYRSGDINSLSSWQSTLGIDLSSVSKAVAFIAESNLHLDGSSVFDNEIYTPSVSSVTTDIDGETRHPDGSINPGADEIYHTIGFSKNLTQFPNPFCVDQSVILSASGAVTGFRDGYTRTVSPAPVMTYTWYKNGEEIQGENLSNFFINHLTQTDSAVYQVMVSFKSESSMSQTSLLKVETPVSITSQPLDCADVCQDDSPITLSVSSAGTVTSYQWQKEDPDKPGVFINITGQTKSNFTIIFDDANASRGVYRVLVKGPGNCGLPQVSSSVSKINVSEPLKDVHLDYSFDAAKVCYGDNVRLTSASTGTVYGYQWQKLIGSTFKDMNFLAYPSSRSKILELNEISTTESGSYRCIVYGSPKCNTSQVITDVININVIPAYSVVKQPVSQSICEGQDFELYVVAQGIINGYRWQKDGKDINVSANPTALTPFLKILDVGFKDAGVYTCIVSMEDCMGARGIPTGPALITVNKKTEIVDVTSEQAARVGDKSTFRFNAHVEEIPNNYEPIVQWYRGNQPLRDDDRIAGAKSSIMTIRDIQPGDIGNDYWVVVNGLCGSDTATNLSLITPNINISAQPLDASKCEGSSVAFKVNAEATGGGRNLSYLWYRNDKSMQEGGRISGSRSSELKIDNISQADAGLYNVIITVQPGNFEVSSSKVSLFVKEKPVIKTQPPASITIVSGKELAISVAAAGQDLKYQWFKNNAAITGATASQYTKASATTADEGTYYCKVSNDCGEVNTVTVTVAVQLLYMMDAGKDDVIINLTNEPNPLTSETTIRFSLTTATEVRLSITDNLGREVAIAAQGTFSEGEHNIRFAPIEHNLSSGVYYYTLMAEGRKQTRQMVIIR